MEVANVARELRTDEPTTLDSLICLAANIVTKAECSRSRTAPIGSVFTVIANRLAGRACGHAIHAASHVYTQTKFGHASSS